MREFVKRINEILDADEHRDISTYENLLRESAEAIEAYEAKLKIAVEALEWVSKAYGDTFGVAREALARIKGETT